MSTIVAAHYGVRVRRASRFVWIAWRALASVLVAALALVMVLSAVAVFWFHLAVHPILSGSMRPTFGPGWMVVTRPIPVSQVKPGEILLFHPPGSAAAFAHRVISVGGSPNHPIITTKGDANPVADPWRAQLKGTSAYKVVAQVPKLGWLLAGGAKTWMRALLVGLVGIAVSIWGARALLAPSQKRRAPLHPQKPAAHVHFPTS
ncbi:MAG TPA: signal peptidase I [Acidimicrobiales bacterium]